MRNVARALSGLIALLFLIFGVRYMFAPASVMESAGLVATSELGLATVRALIGGGFLTFGILLVMHVVLHQNHGVLRMAILFLLLSIIGRIVGLVADGVTPEVLRNLVPVSAMFVVSVISLVLFLRSEPDAATGASSMVDCVNGRFNHLQPVPLRHRHAAVSHSGVAGRGRNGRVSHPIFRYSPHRLLDTAAAWTVEEGYKNPHDDVHHLLCHCGFGRGAGFGEWVLHSARCTADW